MTRKFQIMALVVVSGNNLSPQIAALLFLEPRDFGVFSLGYLTYALAASISLSTVSEAHSRAISSRRKAPTLEYYAAASTWVALIFALVAVLIFAMLTKDLVTALLSFIAVGGASRRTAIRYYEVSRKKWRQVLLAESPALIVFLGGLATMLLGYRGIDVILIAWSASGLLMWVLGSMRRPGTFSGAKIWMLQHKREIRPLLRDSLVLDFSAIGTPYILAPILGTVSFGIYRAVSNFNAPARLILSFIRPYIATISLRKALASKFLFLMIVLSVTWGTAFSGLLLFLNKSPSGISMLDALSSYWLPTGIFMASTMGAQYFYLVARTKVTATKLWHGRLVQSSIAVLLPVVGALVGELEGAIWCYALATVAGGLTWCLIVGTQAKE